MANILEPVTQY